MQTFDGKLRSNGQSLRDSAVVIMENLYETNIALSNSMIDDSL